MLDPIAPAAPAAPVVTPEVAAAPAAHPSATVAAPAAVVPAPEAPAAPATRPNPSLADYEALTARLAALEATAQARAASVPEGTPAIVPLVEGATPVSPLTPATPAAPKAPPVHDLAKAAVPVTPEPENPLSKPAQLEAKIAALRVAKPGTSYASAWSQATSENPDLVAEA